MLEVNSDTGRMLVEGVQMIKRHTRPNPAKQIKGGIAEKESSIHASNVMVLTPGGVPTRIGYKVETEGGVTRRTRVARKDRRGAESKRHGDQGKTERALHDDGDSGAREGVRLQEHHGRAEDREDLDQHRHGRGDVRTPK